MVKFNIKLFRSRFAIVIFILLAFSVIFFSACKRDLKSDNPSDHATGVPNVAAPVISSITGLIVDENSNPFAGVTIKSGGVFTTTDNRGYFRFNNIALDQYASLVTAEATGYFKAYRVFSAGKSNVQFIKIQLIPKKLAGTVSALTGGSVTLTDNSVIALPAGGIVVKASGIVYNGTVKIFAKSIDPNDTKIAETVPGSFMGVDKDNNRVLLKSFGMIAIELENSAGEPLQLATGKTAIIKQSIPASLIATAPSSIPMWFVDENTGVWKEEGVAKKNGNFFEGSASHFSFWNFDTNNPFAYLEFTLRDTANKPLPYILIKIESQSSGSEYAYSDSAGRVRIFVPATQALNVKIYNDYCDNLVYQQSISPILQNTDLGVIIVSTAFFKTIAGAVKNCNGLPVSSGNVQIYVDSKYYNTAIANDGSFQITVNPCFGSILQLFAIDGTTSQQGNTKSLTVGTDTLNPVQLNACGVNLSVNNTIFAGSGDGSLYALDLNSGNIKWTYKTGGSLNTQSPIVFNNTVYIGGTINSPNQTIFAINAANGTLIKQIGTIGFSNFILHNNIFYSAAFTSLYAIDAISGTLVWQKPLYNSTGIFACPTILNNVVYIGSTDSLYAFNVNNGNAVWKTVSNEPLTISGPMVADPNIYVGGNGTIFNQQRLYSYNLTTGALNWSIQAGGKINSSPTCANGVVYVGSHDKKLYAIDTLTHTIKWTFLTGGIIESSPLVQNNIAYVGSYDKYLYAIDAITGLQKWRFNVASEVDASPLIVNGIVYTLGYQGILYALNANTGSVIWSKQLGLSNFNTSCPCIVDQNGVIYYSGKSGSQN